MMIANFLSVLLNIGQSELIIMQLLTTLTSFLKSRQKILLKRRKIHIKNRPVSRKRLTEEKQVMNYSYEMKLVSIKKQLDRKKSKNHHINEVIEQLFYPEMQLTNEEEVTRKVRQLSSVQMPDQDDWEEAVQENNVAQELRKYTLPIDLFTVHQKSFEEFDHNNYARLVSRLSYYCHNRLKIMKYTMENWNRTVAKMKSSKVGASPPKCNFLFLEREQITRHPFWANMVSQIHKKMLKIEQIEPFNKYLEVLLTIQRSFYFIPANLFQLAFTRNSLADFSSLTESNISELMKMLKYRSRIKYSANVKIQNPEQKPQNVQSMTDFARKLATTIIRNPQRFEKQDFLNIFIAINSHKKRMKIITQQSLTLSEQIMSSILNQVSFENVQTYLTIYDLFNRHPNIEFMEILKYDLYRKSDNCINYFSLLILINRIKQRKVTFKSYRQFGTDPVIITLEGYELLIKLGQSISRLINKLRIVELDQLLDAYFNNQVNDLNLVQVVSTQFVKKGRQMSLQTLGKGLFKITLLGHRSKLLAKFVFGQFVERYHKELRRYKQEGTFLFPTSNNEQVPQTANFKQVHLQECLLKILWALIHQTRGQLKKQVKLQDLLTLIPIKIQTTDPLSSELILNINKRLEQYQLFPKIIPPPYVPYMSPDGRLNQYQLHQFSKSQIERLMWQESRLTNHFVGNYNYKANKYLRERWSSENVYDLQDYVKFIMAKQINSEVGNCYFDDSLTLTAEFVKRRFETIKKNIDRTDNNNQKIQMGGSSPHPKKRKLYDLLL